MRKVKREDQSSVKHLAALESQYFRDHLAILDCMAMLQYEDGTPRTAGYLTIRTNGSAWMLSIKDPDSASQMTATGKTLDEAFDTLQLLLGSEAPPWEPDPYLARQQGSRKKK